MIACAFCHSIFASAAALMPEARSPFAVSSGEAAGKSEPNRILSGGINAVSEGSAAGDSARPGIPEVSAERVRK